MVTDEFALAWAQARKKGNETVMIASCPCCKEKLAIYVEQSARQEVVPDTSPPKPEGWTYINGTIRSSR